MWNVGTFVPPMLASPASVLPSGPEWTYEIKWDGVRAQLHVDAELRIRLFTRRGREVSALFPELQAVGAVIGARSVVDGELVVQRAEGGGDFAAVMGRLTSRVRARENPITFVAFDLLADAGVDLLRARHEDRRRGLARRPRIAAPWYAPEGLDGVGAGEQLLEAVRARGLEGVVAKHRDSIYRPGRRTSAWVKVLNPEHVAFGRVARAHSR